MTWIIKLLFMTIIWTKYNKKKRKLYHIFIDLEKAFDRVPRKVIEWALRRKMVPERMVKAIMALYAESRTRVKTVAGVSKELDIRVGVHQGRAGRIVPFYYSRILANTREYSRILANTHTRTNNWKVKFSEIFAPVSGVFILYFQWWDVSTL